ncbi:DUF262 domain-containing protein [Micromonospora haikouensis]|uniref:GmrSD restriction endonuclease domain-containing protein n=1 Tax=Micromonospora haikouensis TaxID=686309 RepID=UPI00341E3050
MSMTSDLSVRMWSVDYAVSLIERGMLGLPDFQRRFEWTAADVRAYLSTVLSGLPSGTLLLAQNSSIKVALRPLVGAPPLTDIVTDVSVILDGQQRLTGLYQALTDVGPERYFVDFTALVKGADMLQDEVVVSVPIRDLGSRIALAQNRGEVLVPFGALRNPSAFFSWLNADGANLALPHEELGAAFARKLQPVDEYRMPVTVLGGDLRLGTVAHIFERLNKWGQRLDAFDLLVARLQSTGWSLRGAWDDALQSYPAISRVFADNGMVAVSAISLLMVSDVRRSAILSLPPSKISENWDDAIAAVDDVANLLLREGFRKPELIPYEALVTAMIAARMREADLGVLRAYLWTAAANRRYEVASNTTVVSDFHALAAGQLVPELDRLELSLEMIETNTRRSSRALWATLTSLLLSQNPLDLATGDGLTSGDPGGKEAWRLTSLAKGGRSIETEEDVPIRLRTAAQLFATPSGLRQIHKRGLLKVAEDQLRQPTLFGSIDDSLRSQLMPDALSLLGGMLPGQVIRVRAERILELLEQRSRRE